jgi:hypothetical protein
MKRSTNNEERNKNDEKQTTQLLGIDEMIECNANESIG